MAWLLAVASIVTSIVALAAASPAGAENPSDVIDDLNTDGVYVSRVRRDVDADELANAVQLIRLEGLRLVVLAPINPLPDPESFARRIQEAVDADAAIVLMEDGTVETYTIDELSGANIRAAQAARGVGDPVRAVTVYAQELTSERVGTQPPIIRQLVTITILLCLLFAAALLIERSIRHYLSQRPAARGPT